MRFGLIAASMLMLTGCFGTPDLPRLADVDLAENVPESGLISTDSAVPETVLQELETVENLPTLDSATATPKIPRRRGLFGMFRRGGKTQTDETDPVAVEAIAQDSGAEMQEQASGEDAEIQLALATGPKEAPQQKRGLFGPRRPKPDENAQIKSGVVLPFGEIGVACGVRGKALGTEVDRFPARGKGYRLYDSNPTILGPRTYFLTGLKDGCPRQFTAAMAMLGTPVLHEQMRYDKSNKALAVNATDVAYEKIKAKLCKTASGKPCPEKRVGALEKATAFVTAYPRFGTNGSWFVILLHKGKVTSSSMRSR